MGISVDTLNPLLQLTLGVAESASPLEDIKNLVDLIGTVITALAVVVGGVWAYFKFVKGRTYRPRLEVTLDGDWLQADSHIVLRARIAVKNIGASVVRLIQHGTGLKVSAPDFSDAPLPRWTSEGVYEILKDHAWIEPGEMVSDDVLLDVSKHCKSPLLFEARLVWKRSKREGNIVVMARQVIAAADSRCDSPIDDHNSAHRRGVKVTIATAEMIR